TGSITHLTSTVVAPVFLIVRVPRAGRRPGCPFHPSEAARCASTEDHQPPSPPSFLKDQPRLRHIPHRDRHQFPPTRSKFVQPGLHILGVGKHFNDFVLEPFRLLGLYRKRLSHEKQNSKRTKANARNHPNG